MNQEELKKLRENLPKGAREILAERFGCSLGHINNTLLGNRENAAILIAAVELISEHKKNLAKATEYIQTL